jgi:hypothetical protein
MKDPMLGLVFLCSTRVRVIDGPSFAVQPPVPQLSAKHVPPTHRTNPDKT